MTMQFPQNTRVTPVGRGLPRVALALLVLGTVGCATKSAKLTLVPHLPINPNDANESAGVDVYVLFLKDGADFSAQTGGKKAFATADLRKSLQAPPFLADECLKVWRMRVDGQQPQVTCTEDVPTEATFIGLVGDFQNLGSGDTEWRLGLPFAAEQTVYVSGRRLLKDAPPKPAGKPAEKPAEKPAGTPKTEGAPKTDGSTSS